MLRNKKTSFTLMELVIVIIIIVILATFLIPAYFNILERSRITACETNQRVLLGALELYASENHVLPASLSQLPDKNIKQAWAEVLSEPGSWKIRLAYAIADFDLKNLVYAAGGWLKEYLGLVKGPACPADLTPPPLNYSYGISYEFAGRPSSELIEADMFDLVIADSDSAVFIDPLPRHKRYTLFGSAKFAIGITRGKQIFHFPESLTSSSSSNRSWQNRGECRSSAVYNYHRCRSNCSRNDQDCKKDCQEEKNEEIGDCH